MIATGTLWFLIVSTLALGSGSVLSAEKPVLERRRADLERIERRVDALRQDNTARRDERVRLLAELEQSERDVAALARAEHQLGAEIAEQEGLVGDLRGRFAAEKKGLAGEQRALAELFRAAYASGRADRLRLLLNQESASRLNRLLAYYDYINRQRQARIRLTEERMQQLDRLAEAGAEEAQRLETLAASQRETRKRLETAQAQRARVLVALEETIATSDEQIQALEADAAALRELVARLERTAQIVDEADLRRESMAERRGELPWPVAGPPAIGFGTAREATRLQWEGVILRATEGTPVRAVYPGRVAYADWLRGFGLLLIIDHGEGYLSLYGNNQALLKQAGEWVAAGDPVALSGTTGGRGANGLYFALRRHGKPLDPEDWCSTQARFPG